MGQETTCTLEYEGRSSEGRAFFEIRREDAKSLLDAVLGGTRETAAGL